MNPYVGMKKFSGSLFLSQDFFILPPLQKEYAMIKYSCNPGRRMGSQKLGS